MSFKERMYDSMLVGVVADTLRKQYAISDSVSNDHLNSMFGEDEAYLNSFEYKRLRRGVRWVLSRSGLDGSEVMTDKVLKGILSDKLKIAVKGSV